MTEYQPPRHVALINASTLATDREVAFIAAALRLQSEQIAADWGWKPCGVSVYSPNTYIHPVDGMAMFVVDSDGNPDTAGVHGYIAGTPWALVDMRDAGIPSRVASHEFAEAACNLRLDRWAVDELGWEYPREVSDAVQDDGYEIPVTIFGEIREVILSNYLLPSWFDPRGKAPYDKLTQLYPNRHGAIRAPFEVAPGGYTMAVSPDGQVVTRTGPGGAVMAARKFRESSRTSRLAAIAEQRIRSRRKR